MANRSQRRQAAKAAKGAARQGPARPPTVEGPPDSREQQLVEKLRRIEALHARPGSEGERLSGRGSGSMRG